jgi:hypothetical protein
MTLLDDYLNKIKLYLPGKQKNDIIAELSDDIQSKIEEKESTLGRSINDNELEALLREYGDPAVISSRYRSKNNTLSFGRVLIGPEIFPFYIGLLLFNGIITGVWIGYTLIKGLELNITTTFISIALQFLIITVTFILFDYVKRKFPKNWLYPPSSITTLIEIPHWQSVSGVVVWSIFSLWWLLVWYSPVFLFGSAAGNLGFSPVWQFLQLPVFLLLLLGLIQRIVNLKRPKWTLIPPVIRSITNTAGLLIIYFLIKDYPFVIIIDKSVEPEHYEKIAGIFNALIGWGFLFTWLWIFILFNAIANIKIFVQHIRRNFKKK